METSSAVRDHAAQVFSARLLVEHHGDDLNRLKAKSLADSTRFDAESVRDAIQVMLVLSHGAPLFAA